MQRIARIVVLFLVLAGTVTSCTDPFDEVVVATDPADKPGGNGGSGGSGSGGSSGGGGNP